MESLGIWIEGLQVGKLAACFELQVNTDSYKRSCLSLAT
jgi:hypothetical protein